MHLDIIAQRQRFWFTFYGMMEVVTFGSRKLSRKGSIPAIEYERISNTLDKLTTVKRMPMEERVENTICLYNAYL